MTSRARSLAIVTTTAVLIASCNTAPDHEGSSLSEGPQPVPSPTFEGEHTDFVSRPDLVDFPAEVTPGPAFDDLREGFISLSPRIEGADEQPLGNAIIDTQGEPVWLQNRDHMKPEHNTTYNLQFQEYQNQPVITWWEGHEGFGWGEGEIVIADTSYEEISRLAPTEGMVTVQPDFHEARITDNDTLLLLYYQPTQTDLTSVGGPEDGWVADSVFQEYDINSGELLFEWNSLAHVPVENSKWDFEFENERDPAVGTEETPFDYFHINSVNYDGDDTDTFLISARNTHAVYSVDRESGDLNWTVGGTDSDYRMINDSYFSWQHDVQRDENGTLRILDNASVPALRDSSRVVYIELDDDEMTADLADEFLPPTPRLSDYMANAEAYDSGHVMAGWGYHPSFTQFNEDGEATIDVTHEPFINYRTYLSDEWEATPNEAPALVVEGDTAYVSWNGATEVAQWRLFAGDSVETAEFHAVGDRTGFETQLPAPDSAYIAVQALDEDGNVLAASFTENTAPSVASGPAPVPAPEFSGTHTDFVSRPDLPDFPVTVTEGPAADELTEGYVALSPQLRGAGLDNQPFGQVVLDQTGEPVWIRTQENLPAEFDAVNNLQFAKYNDDPAFVWWEGSFLAGWGHGDIVVADANFTEVARFNQQPGSATVDADFHEAKLTEQGTLLVTYYQPHQVDLTSIGGPEDGWVSSGLFQEIDLATGEVLFEWDSLDHVPLEATQWDFTEKTEENPAIGTRDWPFDYFHLNSVSHDGNAYLISARQTHAIYSIDRETGEVEWTLGGKDSDYEMAGESYFAWQHDAKRADDGTIMLFDNSSEPPVRENSRVLWLSLDDDTRTATVARQLDPPTTPRLAPNRAGAEPLPNGQVLVGWGAEPYYTFYNEAGEVIVDVEHDPLVSYRAYFVGPDFSTQPEDSPAVAFYGQHAYVSWNGATEVAAWRVFAGNEADAEFIGEYPREGFETQLPLPEASIVTVQAVDKHGEVLAASYASR